MNASVYMQTVRCYYNITNFLLNLHNRHPLAHQLGCDMGCLLWVQILTDVLLQSLQCCIQHHVMLDCIITAPNCRYKPIHSKYSCGALHISAYNIRHLSWDWQRHGHAPWVGHRTCHLSMFWHSFLWTDSIHTDRCLTGGYWRTGSKQVNSNHHIYLCNFIYTYIYIRRNEKNANIQCFSLNYDTENIPYQIYRMT